jgi:hypothetical protein
MAANTSPIFGLTANLAEVTFVNADGTTAKDLVSAGTNGTKVTRIAVHSDDTAAVNLKLLIHDGTTAYAVGVVRVAIGAGSDGAIAAVNLLNVALLPWLDADGEFFIPSGYKVQVAPLVAVTTAKTVTVVCFAMDY